MRRRVNKSHRNYLIMGLCSILLIMGVGYAAFSTRLNISGTSEITSIWDVEITGIEKERTNGNVTEKVEPSYTKDSATFSVGLELPGDYIYYKVAVTNKGTLAAIATLGNLECTESDAISCGAYAEGSDTGQNIGDNTNLTSQRLIIGPGETEYYLVYVSYNSNIMSQPNITNINVNLTLTYEQSDVGITHTTPDKCYTGKVLENGTLEITDYDISCGTDVIIPEEIDGYTVTRIADGRFDSSTNTFSGVFYNKGITSVIIPDTINYIGYASFKNNNITSLNLPSSVKEIAIYAFNNNNMKELTLNEGLTIIHGQSFSDNNLTSITIPSTVTKIETVAFSRNDISNINYAGDPSKITMSGGVFARNNFTGDEAFIYAYNQDGTIDYTTLNSYAGKIGTNITIPNNIETIKEYAFNGVIFDEIILPEKVKTLENNAFINCQARHIELNENLQYIGSSAFAGNRITTITIPDSVKIIGDSAFASNRLTTVTIGSGIESIGTNAFRYLNSNGTVFNPITNITINKPEGSVSGEPWGAINAKINWLG